MAKHVFKLETGLKLGDEPQLECELREPTAGDVIDASEESEKAIVMGGQPQLVTSPTLVGINTLRRQIVRIGDIPGPLARETLNRLTPEDLNKIQYEAELLDQASRAVTQRGRADGAGEGTDAGDQ